MPGKAVEYNVVREGSEAILKADFTGSDFIPSIEDNPTCMSQVMDQLAEETSVTKILFIQRRDYEYDYAQTLLLKEIANMYKQLVRQRDMFSYNNLGTAPECGKCYNKWYNDLQNIVFNLLKSDPLGAYVELKRILRRERQILEQQIADQCQPCGSKYTTILTYLIKLLDETKLIALAKPYLAGYVLGDREVYRRIFKPLIKPDFMFTKLMAAYPPEGKEIGSYSIGSTEITVFQMPDQVQYLYHMMPPEFKLTEDKYEVVDTARTIMAEHKPTKQEFVDPKRMREVFYHVGSDLIEELSTSRGLKLSSKEVDELTKILIRYTVGFGLIEVLLDDENMQDISINSPMGRVPMFIVHAEFGDCTTNIIPTPEESESWASKLRMISGRPLDEANPIMDTELVLPNSRSRIAVIAPPLNPEGQAYSFRKHRDKPWTYPLLMKYRSLNALAAGLMSFIIDGTRTMLIAGTRSAGKTSLLTAMIVEIMRRYRIITIEDTLEIPAEAFRDLGYNVQQMKVASSMSHGTSEVPAETGLRTTLRLGDSSLIVGEVRSTEAKSLYEAMRVGAMANVVAGTIHGDSPYGVYDRVVNDIGVPKTSFKATDIVMVANPIRSADGLHRYKRVTQLTEVRKHWEDDPMLEGGFMDLMKYEPNKDELVPSDDLINGDSDILKLIGGNVKEWAGNWDALWDNVLLRAKIKQAHLDAALKLKDDDMLEAPFTIKCNDMFHNISELVHAEVGSLDSKMIFSKWENWLNRECKKRGINK